MKHLLHLHRVNRRKTASVDHCRFRGQCLLCVTRTTSVDFITDLTAAGLLLD